MRSIVPRYNAAVSYSLGFCNRLEYPPFLGWYPAQAYHKLQYMKAHASGVLDMFINLCKNLFRLA